MNLREFWYYWVYSCKTENGDDLVPWLLSLEEGTAKVTAKIQCKMFNKVTKMSTVTLKAKKESLNLVNISLGEFNNCRTLNSQWCCPWRETTQKAVAYDHCVPYVCKNYLNTPQPYWKNVFWIVGRNKGTAYQHENIISKIKYSAGNIMMGGCFAAWWPGQLIMEKNGSLSGPVSAQGPHL